MKARLTKKMGWHDGEGQFEFSLACGGTATMRYPCKKSEYDSRQAGEEINIEIEGELPAPLKPN